MELPIGQTVEANPARAVVQFVRSGAGSRLIGYGKKIYQGYSLEKTIEKGAEIVNDPSLSEEQKANKLAELAGPNVNNRFRAPPADPKKAATSTDVAAKVPGAPQTTDQGQQQPTLLMTFKDP